MIMDDLEDLKRQKKIIEEKIKTLQGNAVVFGNAKIDKEHYSTSKPDEWGIYIKRIIGNEIDRQLGWYSIIRSQNRDWCVDQIQTVIDDLQGLLEKLRGEKR